jgi:hypothetical protein
MSDQSEAGNLPKGWNRRVLRDWEIARLLTDLEARTKKRYRQDTTRRDLLLGLLCGCTVKKIAKDLVKKNSVVRTGLCEIYRDIEALTEEPSKSVKCSNLIYVLQKHGYRRGTTVTGVNYRRIPGNLPSPTYTAFVGREEEMQTLLERLSLTHAAHMITVHGIGGVGKTALVLEAARLCFQASCENLSDAPKFDAIIFTSAKQEQLVPHKIFQLHQGQRNLRGIFREIANTLDDPTIIQSPPNEQLDRVRQSLSRQLTLLIVDNMETIDDKDEVIEFLYNLPVCVKVVITTRERLALLPISLRNLPPDDGLQLIGQQAQEKNITISNEDSQLLYDRTGGIPLAIVYALGQVSGGYSLESVLAQLALATGDVARFCFEHSVKGITGQPEHLLLMSLAIFPDPPLQTAVAEVAGLIPGSDDVNHGLARLQELSLINHNQKTGRYEMLSLTREYALAQLAAYPNFEQIARIRWVNWYLDFAHTNAGEDWEKRIYYNKLEEEHGNLRAVLYWCKDHDYYQHVRDLWLLLNHYANLYADWDERLYWLEWLIDESQRRCETSSLVKIMIRKSWLLIRECSLQSLREADEILQQTWILSHDAELCVRADLAESIARLQIRYENYEDARNWLTIEESFVNEARLEERSHIRYIIPVLYHRAEIFYREGEYPQAEALFQIVMQKAEQIEWYRVINSAQNWLADIAILQGDRLRSQQLLTSGLTVAQSHKNKRRLARYERSHAYWESKWGTPEQGPQISHTGNG